MGRQKLGNAARAFRPSATERHPVSSARTTGGNISCFFTKAMLNCGVSCGFTSVCEPNEFSTWKGGLNVCDSAGRNSGGQAGRRAGGQAGRRAGGQAGS